MNSKKLKLQVKNKEMVKNFVDQISNEDEIGGTFLAVMAQFIVLSIEKCQEHNEKGIMRKSDLCLIQAESLEKCRNDLKKCATALIELDKMLKKEVMQ